MAILKKTDEVYLVGTFKGHTQGSISQQVVDNGGTTTKKLTPTTTHVIIPPADWTSQTPKAAAVLAATSTQDLWVLPLDWLIDSIESKKKKNEKDYDLQTAPAAAASKGSTTAAAAKSDKKGNGNGKGKGKRAATESDDEEEDKPAPAPKLVKTTRKGNAPPVDSLFPYASSTSVYAGADGVYYDATLNQTQVGVNANKFYLIQVLKTDSGSNFYCFNRWGRVGENGQNKVFGPYSNAAQAISDFEKKFKDKTKLTWSNRHGPVTSDKYTYLERSFDDDDEGEPTEEDEVAPQKNKKARTDDAPALVSKLEPQVQSLMQMIFNVSTISQTMTSLEYDAQKLPLGKLSKATMDQGYTALKDIAALLAAGGGRKGDFEDLTNRFYSLVPHAFGRNKPPTIDSHVALKRELDLIEALGQLKITTELMQAAKSPTEHMHPLDAQFHNLGLKQLEPIDKKASEYAILTSLLKNTRGETHNSWELKIVDAFKVCRDKDDISFREKGFDKLKGGQRRLLWHGSRSSNYGGILSQGLRIAPPEAPVSGYMFGKGLYLASLSTKSAGYCFHSISNNEGLLMLIEAQLGPEPFYRREVAEYEAEESCRKSKMLATWGIGRTQPAKWEDAGQLDPELKGVMMPSLTLPPHQANTTSSLLYDEFITCQLLLSEIPFSELADHVSLRHTDSTSQVRIRYLLRVKFVNR
ncbi:hypothetical protein RQP46_006303 [Phenoliferia psychrophenolica]